MRDFPSGTVTFLFTDVEGSTRRWEADSPATQAAIERHFTLLDAAIAANNGVRYKSIGDAIQAAFPTALDALHGAVTAQRAILAEDWGPLGSLQVRMALHTGAATPRDGDYLAPSLNRLARLLAAAAGGQMLVSEATRNLLRDALPDGIELRDLGEHRFRDLREPEHVFQIVAPGLPADFPPLRSLSRPTNNLPAQLTTFVGREREVAEVRRLLIEAQVRLLTLTGPGGTGKTRLALRAAVELVAEYPDGVWFVPLAPITNPELIGRSIAEALSLREIPGEPIDETLRGYLHEKRLLLILDNFEHVLDGAILVSDLLATCPELQILATSRAPLRVAGEHELAIAPLALPPEESPISPDEALGFEAVRLFVDRVQAVRPGFALDEQNAATIVAICRALDGLPLAIELAAARIRLLSPEAILARLGSRLTLLTSGDRDRPERQQTLRAAIAWSHDLLSPDEQIVFRRLAVFAGGWSLSAAETVANGAPPPVSALDALAALNENSLIRQEAAGPEEDAADPRFAMLQTIQEFAAEMLDASGEREIIKTVHADLFLQLAQDAEPHLTGPEAVRWLNRLETEHGNLGVALDWYATHGDSTRAVQLAGALWRFWWLRGYISEGRSRLETALAAGAAGGDTPALAAALDGAGVLAETQGDYARAEALHRQALALSRNLDDRRGIARSLENLGVVAFDRGDFEQATTLLEESLSLARELGDRELLATALNDLGRVAYHRGELHRAESLYQESLALRRQASSSSEIARSLNNLGFIAVDLADFSRACALFEESLSLYRETGDKWGAAAPLYGLAIAMQQEGDMPRATALLEESLTLFQQTGDRRNAAVTLLNLAYASHESGDPAEALARYQEALTGFDAVDDRIGIADALTGIATLEAGAGRFAPAARLLGAASSLLEAEAANEGIDSSEQFQAAAREAQAALGDEAFSAAWETGRALTLSAAIAEATTSGESRWAASASAGEAAER